MAYRNSNRDIMWRGFRIDSELTFREEMSMGVYIKGMEMPKSCRDCRFCNGQADTDYGVCAWCDVDGNARDAYTMQDCPLVNIPPHGRLIDAEALIDAIIAKYIRHERHRELVFAVVQIKQDMADIINELPTIIPAEEGERWIAMM